MTVNWTHGQRVGRPTNSTIAEKDRWVTTCSCHSAARGSGEVEPAVLEIDSRQHGLTTIYAQAVRVSDSESCIMTVGKARSRRFPRGFAFKEGEGATPKKAFSRGKEQRQWQIATIAVPFSRTTSSLRSALAASTDTRADGLQGKYRDLRRRTTAAAQWMLKEYRHPG